MSKKNIFLVEDDVFIRDAIKELLELNDFNVVSAVDGKDALDKLHQLSEPPSLILLDLMMPVMDGFQFLAEQERDSKIKNIPVIVISADVGAESKSLGLGVKAFIKKPLNIDDMLGKIEKHSG